jgi:hypothetical protein
MATILRLHLEKRTNLMGADEGTAIYWQTASIKPSEVVAYLDILRIANQTIQQSTNVCTKYDRMFEHKNQDILSEHRTKMIDLMVTRTRTLKTSPPSNALTTASTDIYTTLTSTTQWTRRPFMPISQSTT